MTDVRIDAEMPFIRTEFTADREIRNLASGIGYTVLKIVALGETDGGKNLTLAQALMLLSIPSDMMPLIVQQLNSFRGTMVEFRGRAEKTIRLSEINMTDKGKALLEYGYVADNDGEAHGSMVIYPGRETKFVSGNDVIKLRAGRIRFGTDLQTDAVKYVEQHPQQFTENPQAVLSNIKFDLGTIDAGYYSQPINLTFDPVGSSFVLGEKSGIDREYLAHMDGSELLKKIPREVFDLPGDMGFQIDRWASEPPDGAEFLLPSEMSAGNGLLFYGPQVSHIDQDRCTAVKLPEGYGCDAVWVSMGVGYRFWFVRKDISLEGCPETRQEKIIARKAMDYSESKQMVADMVGGLDILKSDRKKLQAVASAVRDRDLIPDMASAALVPGDLKRLSEVLASLQRIEDRFWSRSMENGFANDLLGWSAAGVAPAVVAEGFQMCRKAGYDVPPDGIAGNIVAGCPPAEALDLLLVHFEGTVKPERFLDVPGTIVRFLTDPSDAEFASPLMQKCRDAASVIRSIGDAAGIPVKGKYVFDWTAFDGERRREISAMVRKLGPALEQVRTSYPDVEKAGAYGGLVRIAGIYGAVGRALSERKVSDTKRRFAAEREQLPFCMDLEAFLTYRLHRMTGSEGDAQRLLATAKKKKLITDTQYDSVSSFMEFSENVRRDVTAELPPTKEWVDAVFALAEAD